MAKLEIELVPETCWWSNVRSQVTRAQWEVCKRFVKERSGARCEICGGVGKKWPVECHETWSYDDERQIQTLVGLIALCPDCHAAKHIGRTQLVADEDELMRIYLHILRVNGWGLGHLLSTYLPLVQSIWSVRSEWEWGLDVSYLAEIGLKLPQYIWGPHERVTV